MDYPKPRPKWLPVIAESIPLELRERDQWCGWKWEWDEKKQKWKKSSPLRIDNGNNASSTKPATWCSFDTSLAAHRHGDFDGVSYMFTSDDDFFGVDEDACRNPSTGELTPWATEIITTMKSYTEVSPSGTGVKIVARGKLPAGCKHVHKPSGVPTFGEKAPEIAVYDCDRAWYLTGHKLDKLPGTCEPRQAELDELLRKFNLLVASTSTEAKIALGKNAQSDPISKPPATIGIGELLDRLITDCAAAPDGQRSERDFALCAAAVRHGWEKSDVWMRVQSVGKFGEKGEAYFERTWRQAEQDVASSPPRTKQTSASRPPRVIEPQRPFPVDVLPAVVRDYVTEAAAAIGCDLSYIALPLLACLARAIGNKRMIRLKRTWCEYAIIWGTIVGKSGTHKSPALDLGTAPLKRQQADAQAAYTEAVKQHELDKAIYERDYAAWKRAKGNEPPPWEPTPPACSRFIVGDITIEALADRLGEQFDGVLVVRDELAGWVNGIAEYKGGKGSDLGHWLAAWSGAPLTVDRKSGKTMIHIPRAAVSIVGGIQPAVLRSAIVHDHMADGLCARLLVTMPDPRPVRWTDDTVSVTSENATNDLIDKLCALDPADDGDGKPIPFALPLTPEAQAKWIEYYNQHREEQATLDDDLAAAWSKLEAYTARFALIFQLCDAAAGEASGDHVDQAAVDAAIVLSNWFGHEAMRVYGVLAESPEDRDRRELVDLIRKRGGTVTARDLMRSSRRWGTADAAEAALQELVTAKAGTWHVDDHGGGRGKPATRFTLADTVDTDINSETPGEN